MLLGLILTGCSNNSTVSEVTISEKSTTEQVIISEFQEINDNPYRQNEMDFSTKGLNWNDSYLIGISGTSYYFAGYNDIDRFYGVADAKTKEITQFYALDYDYDIFLRKLHNGRLIIGRGKWEGSRTCHYELVDVTNGEEKILCSIESQGYPMASLVDEYAVINYAELIEGTKHISKVVQINLDTKEEKVIWESEYLSDGANYTGTYVPDIKGWKDGVCFQKVFMDNEYMYTDNTGTCTLCYYSFETGEIEELTAYPYKVLYICGNKEVMLVYDYVFDTIEKNQGHFILYEDGRYNTYDILGTEFSSEIKDSFILSDGSYLLHNDHDFIIYNMNDRTYYKERYDTGYGADITIEPEDLPSFSHVHADGNRFAYSKLEDGKLTVYEYMPK